MPLLHRLVTSTLPFVPTPVMRRLSSRYIAGETLAEALAALRGFADRGYGGVLDILGEDVDDAAAARGVLDSYRRASDAVADQGLDAYVSVKPTHLGLRLSEELPLELYSELARHCAERGRFLRVEMEDHTTTDATLRIFRRLREEHDNVGIVLQSRLRRNPDDIAALPPRSDVRLVKGIYLEPERIAHTDHTAIRDAYVADARRLFEGGHRIAFATHDDPMAVRLLSLVEELDVARERYEFEVLMGVQEPTWEAWRDAGQFVRVYVPYGPDWRAYSTRRLRHNPEILGHVMRATLRLG